MIQYTPADAADGRLLLVANDALLYIEQSSAGADGAPTSVPDLFDALGSDDVIQSVLGLLTNRGLGSTPAFALATWTADFTLHALVRGGLDLRVDLAAGTETISGSGVSTWRETSVGAVAGFAVGDASADSSLSLPLGSGVVRSTGAYVVLDSSGAAAPTAGAHAAPAPAPAAPAPTTAPATSPAPVTSAAPAAPAGMQWPPPSAPRPGETPAAPATPATPATATPATLTPATATPAAAAGTSGATITPPAAGTPPTVSVAASPASIPTFITMPDSATRAPEHTIAEVAEVEPSGYEHLFEETVVRTIEDAAVRPADENDAEGADGADNADTAKTGNTPSPSDSAAADDGDHDGETIMSGDLNRGDTRGGPRDDAPRVPESRQLFLELSTGGREALTQPILVGRAPSVSKVSSGLVPRLVTIPGDKDISRNHAQFALEGDTVVVTDLHSRNGTAVILPGKPPQLLRQGEPTAVLVGTVIDLGGGVTLTVREEG